MSKVDREKAIKSFDETNGQLGHEFLGKLKNHVPLVETTIDFVYGSVMSRNVLDPKIRQLIIVAQLAAQGMLSPELKVHSSAALKAGVTPEELAEVVYLTSVFAGFPKAINAAALLENLYNERGIKPKAPPFQF